MKDSDKLTKIVPEIQYLEMPRNITDPSALAHYILAEDEDKIHLRDYWRSVVKHIWLVIGVTVILTLLAAIYMARKPNIYEAQSRIQVDLENNNPALGKISNNVIVNNPINDPAYFNTQLQVLTGPALLRRVVKTLDLEHNEVFLRRQAEQSHSSWETLKRMVGLKSKKTNEETQAPIQITPITEVAPATSREDLEEATRLDPYVLSVLEGLKVEPVKENRTGYVKETRLIDVSFSHPDPLIAAKIANSIADTFVLSNLEKKTETTSNAGDFLQQRVAELQSQIRNSEERLVNYAKSHQILSLDASQNTVVDRLTGLNRQLLEAENERKLAEAAYRASLTPGAANALAEGGNNSKSSSDLENKLADLKQRRAQLLVDNTEEWPEVKEINQQIAVLEKEIKEHKERASSVIVTNLKTNYQQAREREESLRTAFNQQKGETISQNEAAINYRIIQQEIETNKQLLDGLLQRLKENDVVLAGTPNNIFISNYAIIPRSPIGPKRLRIVAIAFVFALGFGVGLAILLEYLDNTIRSTEDVEKMLHLPAIAVIPNVEGRKVRRLLPGARALQSKNGYKDKLDELLINADPRSGLAEAYRQLRTSVLLSTAGRAPKSLLVASSLPAEGKTTTAVNLATSLAQIGTSVLVIDADMRRPRVHTIFEMANQTGLSTILSSDISEAEILAMIKRHEPTGLYVLTSGPIPPNPAELLGSEQMRKFLDRIEPTFTHIIIDSPPTASFTDSVLLASMVDGILLVIHGGKSSRDIVKRARQVLQDVGGKIVGVILNNVTLGPNDYYYYHTYYDKSYYSSNAEADSLATDA